MSSRHLEITKNSEPSELKISFLGSGGMGLRFRKEATKRPNLKVTRLFRSKEKIEKKNIFMISKKKSKNN